MKLALFGGTPIRTKEFRSKPFLTVNTVELISKLLMDGQLSKFVGSPHPLANEMLEMTSKEADNITTESCVLGGEWVRKFEAKWSNLVDSKYSISVNSATSGLITALRAIGVEGKNVLTTPISFTATVGAIKLAGGIPVFADIDLDTYCLSPEAVEETRYDTDPICIVPVHWCGNAGDFYDICKISEYWGLSMVEDAAQVAGTTYIGKHLGTFGDLGVYSFNEPKNITTGEGGMIVTNHEALARRCRLIRNHGENFTDTAIDFPVATVTFGYNFRLPEILAAIGYNQIDKLEILNKQRRTNWRYLLTEIKNKFIDVLIPQKITVDNYSAYTASFRWNHPTISRDAFADALRAEGIPVATGIPKLLSENVGGHFHLHNAKKLQKEYIGFFQTGWPNRIDDMCDIVKAIEKILDNGNELKDYTPKLNFTIGR